MPIPWLIIGGVAATVAALGGIGYAIFKDPPAKPIPLAKKIAVLGMQGSGKTQFLKTLQGIPYSSYLETSEVEYESFDVKFPNGKTVKIESGIDIGGSDSPRFVGRYKEIAANCDAVILVFDVYKFQQDSEYRLMTRSRFEFLNNGLDGLDDRKVVIGSFADKYTTEEEKVKAQRFVYENLSDVYPQISARNFFMRDMRERSQVLDVLQRVFP